MVTTYERTIAVLTQAIFPFAGQPRRLQQRAAADAQPGCLFVELKLFSHVFALLSTRLFSHATFGDIDDPTAATAP